MAGLPSSTPPAVDESGRFSDTWFNFFSDLTLPPGPIVSVPLGGSPFSYIATSRGHLSVKGGTVADIRLVRGRVNIQVPTSGLIPVATGDKIQIAYSVAPLVYFIPGQR